MAIRGCAWIISDSSVVPERGQPTTKTGRSLLTGRTVAPARPTAAGRPAAYRCADVHDWTARAHDARRRAARTRRRRARRAAARPAGPAVPGALRHGLAGGPGDHPAVRAAGPRPARPLHPAGAGGAGGAPGAGGR